MTSQAPPQVSARVSSRAKTFRDYLNSLSPASATRILFFFVLALIIAEVMARLADPPYSRTAVSSMHGVRAIFQQALDDDDPKILAFGDSTLIGGGIHDHKANVPGQLFKTVRAPRLFNLAVPGGGNTTSVALLDAMRRQKVQKVDRVIIEVLANKFVSRNPVQAPPISEMQPTWEELQRFVPHLNFQAKNLEMPAQSLSERIEVAAQWQAGRISRLYRHRDYFRTEEVGNYPSFWLLGKLTPRSILERLSGNAKGTNRLGARTQDFEFDPSTARTSSGGPVIFRTGWEGEYLVKAIELAKEISAKPPIIWAFPMHYEYEKISPDERQEFERETREFENYLQTLARKSGCEVMIIPSSQFQNPRYWTVTVAHFNNAGAVAIADRLRPPLCRLYDCTLSTLP